MEKKIIKYERFFDDGTSQFVDGEFCENFLTNLSIADGFAITRSYIQYKPVQWTEKNKIEVAVNDLRTELDERAKAYIKAFNQIKEYEKEEKQEIDVEEVEHADALDLCELYHQIRKGTFK